MMLLELISKSLLIELYETQFTTLSDYKWAGREQMKVGAFHASFQANCNNVMGRRCAQEHTST
jgi:hypothetical protein